MGQATERNFKNEIIVAVVALVMLAITILLAILLAESSTPEAASTATTQSMSPTEISVNPTATTVILPTESDTPIPTVTSRASATSQATQRPTTTNTATTTVSPTSTGIPTGVPTKRPSSTAAPTNRPTRTTLPSLTPISTITATLTSTPAATIALVTPQTPTQTPSFVPPTTPASTITSANESCTPPVGWVPYTVRVGDNLFRISLRANVPLSEMQEKNCITDPTRIEVGQVIYVPAYASIIPTENGTGPSTTHMPPTNDSQSNLPARWGCSLPHIQITAPTAGRVQPLNAPFQVSGVATLPDLNNFDFYKVELRRENEDLFRNIIESTLPATAPSQLAVINPADFGAGHYQIILTVVDATGNYPEPCAVRVTFR